MRVSFRFCFPKSILGLVNGMLVSNLARHGSKHLLQNRAMPVTMSQTVQTTSLMHVSVMVTPNGIQNKRMLKNRNKVFERMFSTETKEKKLSTKNVNQLEKAQQEVRVPHLVSTNKKTYYCREHKIKNM